MLLQWGVWAVSQQGCHSGMLCYFLNPGPSAHEMLASNRTKSSSLTFTLTGIPGVLLSSHWMALPLCCLSLLTLLGNSTLLWMIKTDHSLHAPTHYFLSMLIMADLGLPLSTLPTMLAIFWSKFTSVCFETCAVQMYFICISTIEPGALVAMVSDCFIAICHSLHYAVPDQSLIMKTGRQFSRRASAQCSPLLFSSGRCPSAGPVCSPTPACIRTR